MSNLTRIAGTVLEDLCAFKTMCRRILVGMRNTHTLNTVVLGF